MNTALASSIPENQPPPPPKKLQIYSAVWLKVSHEAESETLIGFSEWLKSTSWRKVFFICRLYREVIGEHRMRKVI